MRPTDIKAENYTEQLQSKTDFVQTQFAHLPMPVLEVFESAPLRYRMRAEFRMWHEGDDLQHIMFDQVTKDKYEVTHFPPASELINQVMHDLVELLRPNTIARKRLFEIDYLATVSGEILVSLLYHKALDEAWVEEIKKIRATLREKYSLDIVGRAKKQKFVLDRDFVMESLTIKDKAYTFKQVENSFTQPNAGVNIKMIEWALNATKADNAQHDLLELYCGAGNFSVPLAQNFRRVLATEISKTSVYAAQDNIEQNGIDNLTILRMSSEEFVQAQKGERKFRRLEGVELSDYDCRTVLVDPPRAGLDDATLEMVKEYDNILYFSCNPDTLNENLVSLLKTHKVSKFALFDQFPYTHHAECGIYLTAINSPEA
ncbi:tRNA (uridine(54)-C5)-methyltransferase TrmA [Leucothrix arctica]|uniref:tRNA/tmRNA (uracil-C(5))-methyltransferase n=1 Tax=Leucothrix arctica TaxID=1481894 RepID=A0A317CTA0_9GAMM|nr:tRNA (uridine(54)-C5)-methyltransferase TrmA [Leucothrix arctica]PWQ99542.1 tRNA (uridine(54)-C5)-methyltransferase TrmA [Leucothrix arctica]